MKNQIQQGRSMVEMLGVLAIIGVLSIGGIAGYTMAMNRYKANQILDITAKIFTTLQALPDDVRNNSSEATKHVYHLLNLNNSGHIYEATFGIIGDGDIKATIYNPKVCKILIKSESSCLSGFSDVVIDNNGDWKIAP